jgi:hypothetical protein
MTLSEEEKNRIRDEEVFRQEIRRELEAGAPQKTRGKKIWALLNSSFALWFLSSVVVAGITAVVTVHEKNNNERIRKEHVQHRLATELAGRATEGLVSLRLDPELIKKATASWVYHEALSYLDNCVTVSATTDTVTKTTLDFSSYPEFRHIKFTTVIYELGDVVAPAEIPALEQAHAAYRELTRLADHAYMEESHTPYDEAAARAAVTISLEILGKLQAEFSSKGVLE